MLKKVLLAINKKSCCLDPAPTHIISDCFAKLYPLFLNLINTSISESNFPTSLKYAVVTPIIKDSSGDRDCLKNYRPISNLPFLSKLEERAIYEQLKTHIEDNKLLCHYQSSYRPGYSCETAMTKVVNDIQYSVSIKNCVALVTLDSSSAFDTVDHQILLNKLKNQFYIQDSALKFLESYIEDRKFSVRINGTSSSVKNLKCGVPQGSLLGPLLYILYTSELQQVFNYRKTGVN